MRAARSRRLSGDGVITPFLRSRLPTLWSRSYYAGSVGSVSEAVMRKYIESQKGK